MTDLDTIRLQPQETTLYLSAFQPRTVFACLVNKATIARGERIIPFDTVSIGSYLDVESGMTLLVGSSSGAKDIGKIRIKSITDSYIIVSENSHINWADNLYLTVLRYWEVWPVYPLAVQPDPNVVDVVFYKDYDIAYTNQNSILGALVCAGSHRATWAGESLYFSASGTSHLVDGTTLSYDWAFEGGSSITGSTSNTPGYVRFDTPGHYVVRLIVTGSNGSVDTTYRYVSIYNQEEKSTLSNSNKNWNLDGFSGGRSEGGNTSSITVSNKNITIDEGSNVVIFTDDWYGGVNSSFGGSTPNGSKILFSGNVLNNSIKTNYAYSRTSFEVGNVTEIMKCTETYSISLESTTTPTAWFQMNTITGKKALYHYLRWHSTVLYLADFEFLGTDQNIQYFDTDRQSLYDACSTFMQVTYLGSFGSDRQGKLYAQIGHLFYSNPTGTFPADMSINKADWMNEPTISEIFLAPTSYVEVGGVAYSGNSTGTYGAFLSQAPGSAPHGRGKPDTKEGLAVSGQDHLNIISGNLYANSNSEYPLIDMEMSCGFRNLDSFPLHIVGININPQDTVRGVDIHRSYIVDGMDWKYSSNTKSLLPSLRLANLVNGDIGETLLIPNVPDNGGFGDNFGVNGFGLGNFKFPPLISAFPSIPLPATPPTIALADCLDPAGLGNQFDVNWSRSHVGLLPTGETTDIRKAYIQFPCTIRPAPNSTYLEFSSIYSGDASSHFAAYAILGGQRILTGTILYTNNGTKIIFSTLSPLTVDGFELELESGLGTIIEYIPKEIIDTNSVAATDSVGISTSTIIGNWYSIEGVSGVYNNGVGASYYGAYAQPSAILQDGGVWRSPSHRWFFQATSTSHKITVDDYNFADNTGGPIVWALRNAQVISRCIQFQRTIVHNVCPPQ